LLRNLHTFFNITFKIKECEDDVFGEDSDEDEKIVEESEDGEEVKFPRAFTYSCLGIGLTNFARKLE
jgi:hypothetical protein